MPDQVRQRPHNLILNNREKLSATGIERIEYFSPEAVAARTPRGKMIVKGENLYVENLEAETGDMLVRGTIREIVYEENDSEKSILRKLFK
jgi:sporulation protein YabP